MKTLTRNCYPDIFNAEYLSQGSLFGALTPDCLNFLLSEGRLIELEAGENAFENGQKGDSFFIVLDGELSFFRVENGGLTKTRDIGFGEEVGFVGMIALQDHIGFAKANCRTLVLEVSCELYARLQESYPSDFGIITINLSREMARTIRKLSIALGRSERSVHRSSEF